MKDLSFFLLKNALGAKMRKGFKHFCSGDGSTSTLNQQKMGQGSAYIDTPYLDAVTSGSRERQPTLEEMILQLELEEAASRRAKVDEYGEYRHHRMSCVNSSDILRSARNALNQYPRFSLDGKDAMYRSSFRNMVPLSTGARNSLGCHQGSRKGLCGDGFDSEVQKLRELPATIGGESVVWCRPGVVAKLMGLEAMPIPVQRHQRTGNGLNGNGAKTRQNLRKSAGKLHEIERRRVVVDDTNGCSAMRSGVTGCCSSSSKGYCVMKPLGVELPNEQFGWPMRRLRQNATSPC
ncbi:uncharacterized protein [Coffea arabica]|uniref:DUF3741 domain-containing protein n=1 Tax=Coffea arabica TaxID=13443 RepID=A0A6P6V2E6_COFAR|nr:uncharacterized protein LOC113716761 [Coffea arabica]